MSESLRIEVDVIEERRVFDDRVVAVDARADITVPVDGSYSFLELELLKLRLNEVLRKYLPDCLLHDGGPA